MSQAPQVFISYARDGGVSEQAATALHEQLVQAGIATFRDVENIDPGSHWAAVIEQQLLASQLMVVVVSKPALDPQRWVMRECLFAANTKNSDYSRFGGTGRFAFVVNAYQCLGFYANSVLGTFVACGQQIHCCRTSDGNSSPCTTCTKTTATFGS